MPVSNDESPTPPFPRPEFADLLLRLRELQALLTTRTSLSDVDKCSALAVSLGNLLAIVDYVEFANDFSVDAERIEAEFDRYRQRYEASSEGGLTDEDVEGLYQAGIILGDGVKKVK
jgi:hypothetical protein